MNSRVGVGRRQLILLALSSALAVALAEALVRLIPRQPRGFPSASMMLSSDHFRLDHRGAVRHIPNETVRLVTVIDGTVEFDVTVQTNNLGLVDHRDYPVGSLSRRHYAFVGDSLTYGAGAEPWVPKLRDRLRDSAPDLEIYNLGVIGASVQHFRRLLASAARDLPITHIVALPVTDDFYRPWWVPMRTVDGVALCPELQECGGRTSFQRIDRDAPVHALVARAAALSAASGPQPRVDPWWRQMHRQSELYLLLRGRIRQLLQRFQLLEVPDRTDARGRALLRANMDALAGMRSDFPDVPLTLVHFPQLDEVGRGQYALHLEGVAAGLGIRYLPALTLCSWSPDMYHPRDTHPNAAGYENMARCLTSHLFGGDRRAPAVRDGPLGVNFRLPRPPRRRAFNAPPLGAGVAVAGHSSKSAV